MIVHSKKKANKARTRRRRSAPKARATAGATGSPHVAAAAQAPLKAEIERHLRAQLAALTGGLAPDDYLDAWWSVVNWKAVAERYAKAKAGKL